MDAKAPRLDTIDLLRGFVIALMVLDHTRDYFHVSAYTLDPTDPARTHVWLFITRWITHLCAPTFVFLAGVSVYLQGVNGKDRMQLTRFLLSRGVWLIVLELTVLAFGLNFALPFLFLQVIWAIGASMILLAGVIWLPRAAAAMIGVVIVAGHQLLAPISPADVGAFAPLWTLAFEFGPAFGLGFISYPAIPWFGVMCLGYALGPVFMQEPARRNRTLLTLALSAIALFLVLRAINAYGDPAPWKAFPDAAGTVMSFFNVSKYPPSLLFVLITLGVSLLCLLAFQRLRGVARARVAGLRQNTAVHLRATYICGARCVARGRGARRLSRGVSRELPDGSVSPLQGRLRIQPRCRLSGVAGDTRRTVSGVALVRGGEAAAARLVVELPLVESVTPNSPECFIVVRS